MLKVLGRFTGGLTLVALAVGAGAGLAAVPLAAGPAAAATTITVNDAVDSATVAPTNCTTATGDCTLRSAVAAFNAVSNASDVTIDLPDPTTLGAGLSGSSYNVSAAGGGVLVVDNPNGDFLTLTISYTGPSGLGPITGTGDNMFQVDTDNTLDMTGFSLSGGDNTSTTADGGAILDYGTLNLSGSEVYSNAASSGGGIAEETETPTAGLPAMTLTDDTISDNTANAFAGGVGAGDGGGVDITAGPATISGGTIGGTSGAEAAGNTATAQGGGLALLSPDATTVSDVTIGGTSSLSQGNTASEGGGVESGDGTNAITGGSVDYNAANENATTHFSGTGGGIAVEGGTNSFTGQDVEHNQAVASTTTGAPNAEGGGFYVNYGIDTLNDETITDNTATTDGTSAVFGIGGGLYTDDTLDDTTAVDNAVTGGSIDGNLAYEGGGVYVNDGTNTVSQVDVSSNTATDSGGGFWIEFSTGSPGDVATVTKISQSTISANAATGSGFAPAGDGAGILADVFGSPSGCNTLDLTNDTIANNAASTNAGGYYGMGCTTPTTHTTALLFDTIAGNSEAVTGGAANLQTTDDSVITAGETIVAGGTAGNPNCDIAGTGKLTSQGYNLDDGTSCHLTATGDISGKSADLGALGANGGPTNTELPATGSPAIGAISDSVCTGTGVTTDQRGETRPSGATYPTCTIGAVQVPFTGTAPPPPPPPPAPTTGYWMVGNDGGIFNYGNASFHGSMGGQHLNAPIVAMAGTADGGGYWEVASDGGIFNFGDAVFHGSMGGQHLNAPIVGIAATPDGGGYWEVASDGGIFNFGDAHFYGSMGGQHLNKPIVGIASTHDGLGYWEVASDGGIFAYGDAHFYGSTGAIHLNKPVVAMVATADGGGYWFVASDGGIFNYGDAAFFGSAGSLTLAQPVVGMGVAPQGGGYWLFAADGGLFNYGSATYLGSVPGSGVHVTNIVGGATT